MPATWIPNEGLTLGYATTSGGTYTPIPAVKAIKRPGLEIEDVPTVYLDSTFDSGRPGKIPKASDPTFKIEMDPNSTEHQALYAACAAGTIYYWKVTYPDGKTTKANVVFPAYIRTIEPDDAEGQGNATDVLTLRVTGAPVRTAGSP